MNTKLLLVVILAELACLSSYANNYFYTTAPSQGQYVYQARPSNSFSAPPIQVQQPQPTYQNYQPQNPGIIQYGQSVPQFQNGFINPFQH